MNKYLKDIGLEEKDLPWNWCNKNDDRQGIWAKEREEIGFDSREIWSLDFTLSILIYERLKHYRETAPIDMDNQFISHKYEVDGEDVVLGKIIDRILESLKVRIKSDGNMTEEEAEEFSICWGLLGKIHWSLWW